MNAKILSQGIFRAVLLLGAFVLSLYILYLLKSLLIYIVIAAIISLMGRPIVDFLKKHLKFNNTLATLATMLIFTLVIVGLFSLLIPIITQQSENLSLLNIQELEQKTEILFNRISNYFSLGDNYWEKWMMEYDWTSSMNLNAIPDFLNFLIVWLSSFTIGFFSILFISFFFLKDDHLLERMIFSLIKKEYKERIKKSLKKINNLLSRYFIGLLIQISILLVIYSTVLLVFGIKNAFIIAFLCALLNLIPYIGPLIAAILMLILSMTSNIEADFSTVILPKAIFVMIGFVIGQLIDNFFSQPFIFSSSVKSHPLEIFIIILIAGLLFGTTGLIFAVPLYTALKVIVKEFFAQYEIVQSLTKDI